MSHRGAAAGLLLLLPLAACGSSGPKVADDPMTSATATLTPPASSVAATTSASPATLITLDEPADGTSVSGSLAVSGTANSDEANVPWRILDASGAKVLDGSFTADGWMDKLYPYRGTVDVSSLAPGSYTLVVSIDDESDGEGTPPQKVSRTITVS